MSHPEQLAFFRLVAASNKPLVAGGRLLEIGSYDVNGSVREIFADAGEYVGVDLADGPGVDRVGFGHEVYDPAGSFDMVISGECFEHDPHWRETLANMVRLTRPGGVVAVSCASRGRPEHGTRRTTRDESPGTQAVGLDYYRNVTTGDLAAAIHDDWFSDTGLWYIRSSFDLYFAGVRAGGDDGAIPAEDDVEAIESMMPFSHRAARWPLRALAASRISEGRYQSMVLPYWLTLLRLLGERARRG